MVESILTITLGAILGFSLKWINDYFVERKRYKKSVEQTVERIKKSMQLKDVGHVKHTTQRMADLLPMFKEKEQIEILLEIGFESTLMNENNDITEYVIEELRWLCLFYEQDEFKLVKRSRKDEKRVKSIQNTLYEISVNIIEYTQTDKLLGSALYLFSVLDSYAVKQEYVDSIEHSISIYKGLGELSIGISYSETGYKVLDFRTGLEGTIQRLRSLKRQIQKSSIEKAKIIPLTEMIDETIKLIKKEYSEKIGKEYIDDVV